MHDLTNTFPRGRIRDVFATLDKAIAHSGQGLKTIALKKEDYQILLNSVKPQDRDRGLCYRDRRLVPCG